MESCPSRTWTFSSDIQSEQFSIKFKIYHLKSSMISNKATLLDGANNTLKTSIKLASEKALDWLTVLCSQPQCTKFSFEHVFTCPIAEGIAKAW